MGIVFDVVKEWMEERTSENAAPILRSLFGMVSQTAVSKHTRFQTSHSTTTAELTVMGFMGLVMFAVDKSGALDRASLSVRTFHPAASPITQPHPTLSPQLFGSSDVISTLFESVHMTLFLVFVLFLLTALYLVSVARVLRHEWRENEVMSLAKNRRLLLKDYLVSPHPPPPSYTPRMSTHPRSPRRT